MPTFSRLSNVGKNAIVPINILSDAVPVYGGSVITASYVIIRLLLFIIFSAVHDRWTRAGKLGCEQAADEVGMLG